MTQHYLYQVSTQDIQHIRLDSNLLDMALSCTCISAECRQPQHAAGFDGFNREFQEGSRFCTWGLEIYLRVEGVDGEGHSSASCSLLQLSPQSLDLCLIPQNQRALVQNLVPLGMNLNLRTRHARRPSIQMTLTLPDNLQSKIVRCSCDFNRH